jgi:hypothetical protein
MYLPHHNNVALLIAEAKQLGRMNCLLVHSLGARTDTVSQDLSRTGASGWALCTGPFPMGKGVWTRAAKQGILVHVPSVQLGGLGTELVQ